MEVIILNKIIKISNSELEVMKLLWDNHPLTSEYIISNLSDKMMWNPQTIKTFITRLVKKEAVGYDRVGRTYMYYPIISQNEYLKVENKSFLQKVYDGAIDRFILKFIETEDISDEDINMLQEILESKKKKNSNR